MTGKEFFSMPYQTSNPSPYDPSEGTDTGIFTQADACHDHATSAECRKAGCYEEEFGNLSHGDWVEREY